MNYWLETSLDSFAFHLDKRPYALNDKRGDVRMSMDLTYFFSLVYFKKTPVQQINVIPKKTDHKKISKKTKKGEV